MRENKDEQTNYPFLWLDEIVEVTLNPAKSNLKNCSQELLQSVRERLPGEIAEINTRLKTQAFSLYTGEHVKVVAGHYDQAIRLLRQQARVNLAQYPETGALRDTGQTLLDYLDALYLSIRQRYPDYVAQASPDKPDDEALFKVLCRLSVDQVAIILKAADDIKLLVARSFSLVLRRIVPFLSTERLANFSWKSARSSTYKMEASDKEVAIRTLEALITKIREY
jgi:hypothetical protein